MYSQAKNLRFFFWFVVDVVIVVVVLCFVHSWTQTSRKRNMKKGFAAHEIFVCFVSVRRFSIENVDGRSLERQLRPQLMTPEEMGEAFEVAEQRTHITLPVC